MFGKTLESVFGQEFSVLPSLWASVRSYTLIHGRELDDFAIICFGSTAWRREHWDWLLGGIASVSNSSNWASRWHKMIWLGIFNVDLWKHVRWMPHQYSVFSLHRERSTSAYGAQCSVCTESTPFPSMALSTQYSYTEHSTSVSGAQCSVCIENAPLPSTEFSAQSALRALHFHLRSSWL